MSELISIIITSYNRANYISEAIQSVLTQDYENLELIVIDNCSTDNSEQVIQTFLSDPRVVFIKNETNIGATPSLLKAVQLCKGAYFTHVSSDDYLVNKRFLSEAMARIQQYPEIVIVGGRNVFYDESTGKKRSPESYEKNKNSFYKQPYVNGREVFLEFVNSYPVTMGACVFQKKSFLQFDLTKRAPIYFDLQMILLVLLCGNASFIDEESYLVRMHESNLSNSFSSAEIYEKNLCFIEEPAKYAISYGVFKENEIGKWRTQMLNSYFTFILSSLFKYDRQQFSIFNEYVKTNYQNNWNEITGTWIWKIKKYLFYYPFVGNLFTKVRAKLSF